jgi:alkylated DNA nucleotide flippase Atl1
VLTYVSISRGSLCSLRVMNAVADRESAVASAAGRGVRRSRPATGWEAKLQADPQPKVVIDRKLGDRMLVPTPALVAEEVAAIPRGEVLTVSALRARLAERFGADRTCPSTTAAVLAVLAGCVAEDLTRNRRAPRWPIWRVVGDDGRLEKNWPLSARWRASALREEGLSVRHAETTWAVELRN